MHLDNLLEELGGFGRYQIMLTIVTGLIKIVAVPSMLMMGFAGNEPDWWCVDGNHTHKTNGSYKLCEINGTCERVFTEEMVTIVSEWDLVCGLSWVTNAVISVQMAGMLLGGLVAGFCADAHGRKKTMFFGLALLVLGNFVAAFSVSWPMFTVFRGVIGIGMAFAFVPFYLYQVEYVGKRWRVMMAAMPDWATGMILQSLIAKWIHHWKWMHLTVGCMTLAVLPFYFLLHESVRWLTVKGHLDEAKTVVKKLAAMNRKPVPNMRILEAIAAEEKREGEKAKNYTYLHLFKTRDLAKKTTLTCFSWASSSVIYYGIFFGVKNLSGDIYLNMLLMSLTELPVTPIAIGLSALLKRRWASSSCYFVTCVACFGLAVCTRLVPEDDKVAYINGLAMTAKVTISLAWIILMAFGVEQIPTVIRNLGFATHNTSARIGGVVAAQILSLGGNDDLMAPFIAMGVLSFLTSAACLLLDETKNLPLQDTMKSASSQKEDALLEPKTEYPIKNCNKPI